MIKVGKVKIIEKKEYGDLTIYFSFRPDFNDLHILLLDFLYDLGFKNNDVNELDQHLGNVINPLFYFYTRKYKVSIHINRKFIDLVIHPKTIENKKKLIKIKKYFK